MKRDVVNWVGSDKTEETVVVKITNLMMVVVVVENVVMVAISRL